MNHKNNNQSAVKRIAKRMAKTNRTRNIFAMLAIILTTFMISTIFSIGVSFAENYQVMMTRMAGTTATIFLENPTEEQNNIIKELDYLEAVGTQISIGVASQKNVSDYDVEIPVLYHDESEWENHYAPAISDINGSYPKEADEIMLSMNALKKLGISEPEEGMEIKLNITSESGEKAEIFRLSGWFTNYSGFGDGTSVAFVSEQYCVNNGFTLLDNGTIAISTKSSTQNEAYDRLQEDVPLESGQEFYTSFDVNEENSQMITSTILVIGILALFIVLSGYLLIYNVMYISVSKDIHFYGMLKTIGTSPKQIRKIVRSQLYRLSLFSIPVGLLLGGLTSFIIVPMAVSLLASDGAMPGDISNHPIIFIGSALFAFFAVFLSCRKPAKIASMISPVEALRYTGMKEKKKEKRKASTKGGKLYRLALYNVFREKKRAFLVFASLFMGIITLLSVNSFLGTLKPENYIARYYPHDFTYQSLAIGEEVFDDDFMAELSEIEGITNISITRAIRSGVVLDEKVLEPMLKGIYQNVKDSYESYDDFIASIKSSIDDYGTYLFAIDDSYVETYNKNHKNQIDLEAFRNGEIIIVGNSSAYENMDAMIGESIALREGKTNHEKTVTIGGIFGYDDLDLALYNYTIGEIEAIYVSETFLNNFTDNPPVAFIDIDVEKSAESSVKNQLNQLNTHLVSENYYFEAKSDAVANFESDMAIMNVLSGGVSILLILIGILNFINVMLTGVHARRKELAVMESIGMTKKQVRKMLVYEGLYYALITTGITLTVGNIIIFVINNFAQGIADYAIFHYPVLLMTVIIATLFLICLAVPGIVYQMTARESVTERLRKVES